MFSALVRAIFPPRCVACGRDPGLDAFLCEECREALPTLGSACGRCALGLGPHARPVTRCPTCRSTPPAFAGACAPFRYQGLARALLFRAKLRSDDAARGLLSRATAASVLASRFGRRVEVVVPVPSHPLRALTRGDDPVLALAREVAAHLGLPSRRALRRERSTRKLAGLDRAGRRRTLEGAIGCRDPHSVAGRAVLLVDDVLTTGATADACARALLSAGARRVYVAAACRTARRT